MISNQTDMLGGNVFQKVEEVFSHDEKEQVVTTIYSMREKTDIVSKSS